MRLLFVQIAKERKKCLFREGGLKVLSSFGRFELWALFWSWNIKKLFINFWAFSRFLMHCRFLLKFFKELFISSTKPLSKIFIKLLWTFKELKKLNRNLQLMKIEWKKFKKFCKMLSSSLSFIWAFLEMDSKTNFINLNKIWKLFEVLLSIQWFGKKSKCMSTL